MMLPVASRRLRGLLLGRRRRCGALLPCGARRASTAPLDIRNLAIIAHGDHGKVDTYLELALRRAAGQPLTSWSCRSLVSAV